VYLTYQSGNHEAGEQVPITKEGGADECSQVQVWCDCYTHNTVVSETEEDEEHEKEEVKKFGCRPFKIDHCIHNGNI
jgi:hypothetical protein